MKKYEYIKLVKEWNSLKIKRKYAESQKEFDNIEYYDSKLESIINQIDNAVINFSTKELVKMM